jgi:hypothetical protein
VEKLKVFILDDYQYLLPEYVIPESYELGTGYGGHIEHGAGDSNGYPGRLDAPEFICKMEYGNGWGSGAMQTRWNWAG